MVTSDWTYVSIPGTAGVNNGQPLNGFVSYTAQNTPNGLEIYHMRIRGQDGKIVSEMHLPEGQRVNIGRLTDSDVKIERGASSGTVASYITLTPEMRGNLSTALANGLQAKPENMQYFTPGPMLSRMPTNAAVTGVTVTPPEATVGNPMVAVGDNNITRDIQVRVQQGGQTRTETIRLQTSGNWQGETSLQGIQILDGEGRPREFTLPNGTKSTTLAAPELGYVGLKLNGTNVVLNAEAQTAIGNYAQRAINNNPQPTASITEMQNQSQALQSLQQLSGNLQQVPGMGIVSQYLPSIATLLNVGTNPTR